MRSSQLIVVTLIGLVLACSSNGDEAQPPIPDSDAGVPDSSGTPDSDSGDGDAATDSGSDAGKDAEIDSGIGPAGGKVEAEGSSVEIPAGALATELAVAIEALPATAVDSLAPVVVPELDGIGAPASSFFAFTPHGAQFSLPVTIRLPYTGSGAHVLRLDDESDTSWEVVPGVTFADGIASFQTTRFSVLVVVPCQPLACSGLTADKCGAVPNGCGGTLDAQNDCGRPACPGNQRCSNNACCTPYATCEEALSAAGQTCHPSVSDGCGGTMDCSGACEGVKFNGLATACVFQEATAWSEARHGCWLACSSNADCGPGLPGRCIDANTFESGCSYQLCIRGICEGCDVFQASCPSDKPNCTGAGQCVE